MTDELAAVLDAVYGAGGEIRVEGDDIIISAPAPLAKALLERLRHYKPEIMWLLEMLICHLGHDYRAPMLKPLISYLGHDHRVLH